MPTIIRKFKTDIKMKHYTYCEENKIIGSDDCKSCHRFVSKVCDNERKGKVYTLISKGLVECKEK